MEAVKHQIEYRRLEDIRPYDNNPRRNDEAAKAVANSIREFGFQSPIIVDRDGVIIAGHTRYKAARRLKMQEVPVIVAAELDPERVKALRIADNSTGEVAEWDLQLLVQELTGIDYDMADFGLNLQIKIDEEVKEDDFDAEPPEQPITRQGDLWLLGEHRVLCGDSTSAQDVERLMDGALADLLLTDPPYNVNYKGSNGKTIANDNMAESQFRQFLLQAYSRAFDACRTGASAYVFHADTEGEAFRAMFREAGWGLHGCLVWVKNSLVLGRSDYQWQHEPCLYGWKPGSNHYFINDRSQTTVIDDAKPEDLRHMKKDQLLDWAIKAQQLLTQTPSSVLRCDKPPRNAEHPTMKPVVLCGKLIKNSSLPGQVVLDLFGGSGSTLIACEQLSRKCYTMEYDPRYVDVIALLPDKTTLRDSKNQEADVKAALEALRTAKPYLFQPSDPAAGTEPQPGAANPIIIPKPRAQGGPAQPSLAEFIAMSGTERIALRTRNPALFQQLSQQVRAARR